MGLLHQQNEGIIGNRGIQASPGLDLTGGTLEFYLDGTSFTEKYSGNTATQFTTPVTLDSDNPFEIAGKQSYKFDGGGSGCGLVFPHAANNDLHLMGTSQGGYTLSYWINWAGPSTHSGFHCLYAKRDGGGTQDETFLMSSTHWIASYNGSQYADWRTRPPLGGWVHILDEYGGGGKRTYLNGQKVFETTYSVSYANGPAFAVGSINSSGEGFVGKIADFAIFGGQPNVFGGFGNSFSPISIPVLGENVVPLGIQQTKTI